MSEHIVWETPPETALRSRRHGQYTEFAAAVRARPGAWAIMPGTKTSSESARSAAQNLRRGKMKDFAKGQYEVVVDGIKIYVRFIGDNEGAGERAPDSGDSGEEDHRTQQPNSRSWEAHRVRLWAQDNGHEVAKRGRMSSEIWAAYDLAHQAENHRQDQDQDAASVATGQG